MQQQPHVRLRPSRCSKAHRQYHLWAAALCVLLLWQGPAEAARSASAHRLPRQRALKTSPIGSSEGSLQQKSNLIPQGLDRSTSQSLGKSSSHEAQPSSLISTSDTSVVNTDSLPASSAGPSKLAATAKTAGKVPGAEADSTGISSAQLDSGTSPASLSTGKSDAGRSVVSGSGSGSSKLSAAASAPAAHAAAKISRNVSSQLGAELASSKPAGLPAAVPAVKGTSEAAWLNVSLEFPSNAKAPHNYAEALHKSLLFYWAQRSGPMPVKRLAWRSDSCLECVGAHGEDLSGGYYEAGGSYLKFTLPTAFTVTQLAWGLIESREGYAKVGELEEALGAVKWGADYLVNCHSGPSRLVAMLGDSREDFAYFGPPEEHAMWAPPREAHYVTEEDPGSEVAGEMAAALAATSIAFKEVNATYAAELLQHAKEVYAFGEEHQGTYMDSQNLGLKDHAKHYPSSGYIDELAWGALWIYLATQEDAHLQTALKYYEMLQSWSADNWSYDWDNKAPGMHVLLTQLFPSEMMPYAQNAKNFFQAYIPGPDRTVHMTNGGLSWRSAWGVLRYSANVAQLAMVHSTWAYDNGDAPYAAALFNYGQSQIDYMLGHTGGRSFVVGYGKNPPLLPFHKDSFYSYINYPTRGQPYQLQHDDFHDSRIPNRFIVYGALAGGPQADDSYEDSRGWCCAAFSEVAIDYNAGFQSALAKLAEYYDGLKQFSDCELDLGWDHPNATLALQPEWPEGDCYHGCCGKRTRSRKHEEHGQIGVPRRRRQSKAAASSEQEPYLLHAHKHTL